jgi:hypothetical protein
MVFNYKGIYGVFIGKFTTHLQVKLIFNVKFKIKISKLKLEIATQILIKSKILMYYDIDQDFIRI